MRSNIEYFTHVTLNTGHVYKAYSDKVDRRLYFRLQSLVREAQKPNGVEILPHIHLYITAEDDAYVATACLMVDDMRCPLISSMGSLVDDLDLWESFYSSSAIPLPSAVCTPVKAPYIVDRIDVPRDDVPEFWTMSGDLFQCIAWALLAPEQIRPLVSDLNQEDAIPPMRLMKDINRRWPNAWRELRDQMPTFRSMYSIPDWCIIPVMVPTAAYAVKIGATSEAQLRPDFCWLMCVASMYLWRAGKGLYRFTEELYEELIHQEMDGELNYEIFCHLPEWAVYVETPGLTFDTEPLDGFIAHLDYNLMSNQRELQFLMFEKGEPYPRTIALPLKGGTVQDAINAMDEYDKEWFGDGVQIKKKATTEQLRREFSSILQLLIYLCCDNRDTPPIQHPKFRMRRSGAVDSPKEIKTWDVGVRVSKAIRSYSKQTETSARTYGTHASPRPHIRRAHYHKFLTGPRGSERGYVVHWIPPLPIGMKWDVESNTPVVIHESDKPQNTTTDE